MDNSLGGRKTELNTTSLIELKAELLRKQEIFRQEKLNNSAKYIKAKSAEKKPSIWSKKNAGVLERAQKDLEAKKEEDDAMGRSKEALERKTALYEELVSRDGIPDEDGSDQLLVDFQKKALDRRQNTTTTKGELAKPGSGSSEDQRYIEDQYEALATSRLPEVKPVDAQLKKIHEKWDAEIEEASNQPAGPVHYSSVQFDEIRTHGVGFYQFAKDEDTRQAQMQTLSDLRQQTVANKAKRDQLKEKRKAVLNARLEKVKQRRMLKDGVFPEDKIEEEEEKPKEEPEKVVWDSSWRKSQPVREWDKGKKELSLKEKEAVWMNDRRSERCQEFAPPSMYFNSGYSPRVTTPSNPATVSSRYTEPAVSHADSSLSNTVYGPVEANSTTVHHAEAEEGQGRLSEVPLPDTDTDNELVKETDHKHNPMAELEQAHHRSVSEIPLPTSDGGASETKDSSLHKQNPMAALELVNSAELSGGSMDKVTEQLVSDGLSEIRAEVNYQLGYGAFHQQAGICTQTVIPSEVPPNGTDLALMANQNVSVNKLQYSAFTDQSSTASTCYSNSPPEPNDSVQYHQYSQSQLNDNQLNAHLLQTTSAYEQHHQTHGVGSSDQSGIPTGTTESLVASGEKSVGSTLKVAPQPAHFSSAPMKPQQKQPKYERLEMTSIPKHLPAPPSVCNVPLYPSQEDALNVQHKERDNLKQWTKQFNYNQPGLPNRPTNIPFPSPYVQKKEDASES